MRSFSAIQVPDSSLPNQKLHLHKLMGMTNLSLNLLKCLTRLNLYFAWKNSWLVVEAVDLLVVQVEVDQATHLLEAVGVSAQDLLCDAEVAVQKLEVEEVELREGLCWVEAVVVLKAASMVTSARV